MLVLVIVGTRLGVLVRVAPAEVAIVGNGNPPSLGVLLRRIIGVGKKLRVGVSKMGGSVTGSSVGGSSEPSTTSVVTAGSVPR